jgi:hypothetical protein
MSVYRFVSRSLFCLLAIFTLFGCKKGLDNKGIFITDPRQTGSVVQSLTVDNTGGSLSITASASHLSKSDITVRFEADSNLVKNYNQLNGTNYKPLPARFFSLSSDNATIHAGSVVSDAILLQVTPFDAGINDGDQYMIPVKIRDVTGDMPVTEASRVVYIIIARVLINSAFYRSGGSSVDFDIHDPIQGLTSFTVEFRIKIGWNISASSNVALFMANPSEIFSRFGDVVIDNGQLQVKYAGVQPASSTRFVRDKWYHIAFSLDDATKQFTMYVDGKRDAVSAVPGNIKFDISSMSFAGGYNEDRGAVTVQELRFWTRARTEAEIRNSICAVDPRSPGLYGYWKFNEGTGNTVADATGNGHTGRFTGNSWVTGIRCPE